MAYFLDGGRRVIVPPHAREQARQRSDAGLDQVLDTIERAWQPGLRGRVAIVCGQRPVPVVNFRAKSCVVVTVLGCNFGINKNTPVLQTPPACQDA